MLDWCYWFGHSYIDTWNNFVGDPLEQKCSRCNKYRHRTVDNNGYLQPGYLSGRHPHRPKWREINSVSEAL